MMKIFTNKEMLNMPEGTKVRIKATVEAHPKFHKGGTLSIDFDQIEQSEKPFGICVNGFGVCYDFKAADYELI